MADRGTRRMGRVSPVRTGTASIDRGQDAIVSRLNTLIDAPMSHVVTREVALVSGLNKVPHGLGVPVKHVLASLVPTGATLTSEQSSNLHPESQVWLRLDGVPRATVLILFLPVT